MATTVREFVYQIYNLISASNPTIPLHGNDEQVAIRVMNQVLSSYASDGLLLTIAKTVTVPVNIGKKEIWFTNPDFPTETINTENVVLTLNSPSFFVFNPSVYFIGDKVTGNGIPENSVINTIVGTTVTLNNQSTLTGSSLLTFSHDISDPSVSYIKEGRLANLDNSWLIREGVTYPLIDKSRDEFLSAWKYEPLQGLPRFIIIYPQNDYVVGRLYAAPSQFYDFYARGKFQKSILSVNDILEIPDYFELFFLYAVAKYVSKFKSRGSAWTPDLEEDYLKLEKQMQSSSEINLSITGDSRDLLNGANRVRAGV